MHVPFGFGKQPFLGRHLLDFFWGWGRVAGAVEYFFFECGAENP